MALTHPTPQVAIGTFRAGYGHIRAALAIQRELEAIGIHTQFVDIGHDRYPFFTRTFSALQSALLNVFYRYFPESFIEFSRQHTRHGMEKFSAIAMFFDRGNFDRQLLPSIKLVVASHMAIADMTTYPTVLLGLDANSPGLYNTRNPNSLTVVPNTTMAKDLITMRDRAVTITGPIVSPSILAAKRHFAQREKELQSGRGLWITIATGGSLTHGEEIIGLTKAYLDEMHRHKESNDAIEKIFVIIGDSDHWWKGGNMKSKLERLLANPAYREDIIQKIDTIFSHNPIDLVHMADAAIGASDIIHAKTGELVYAVGGHKVFETFANHPSLAAQEENLYKYVVEKTTDGTLCAIEYGQRDLREEVRKVLQEFKDGKLLARMRAGGGVRVDGVRITAEIVKEKLAALNKLYEEKNYEPHHT